jgi:hypothetical protein
MVSTLEVVCCLMLPGACLITRLLARASQVCHVRCTRTTAHDWVHGCRGIGGISVGCDVLALGSRLADAGDNDSMLLPGPGEQLGANERGIASSTI